MRMVRGSQFNFCAVSGDLGVQPVDATIRVGTGAPPVLPGEARRCSIRYQNLASYARPPGRGVRAYVRGFLARASR